MKNKEAAEWFKYMAKVMPESETKRMFLIAASALEKQETDRWHSVAKEGDPKESGHYFVVDKSPINGNEPHARYFNVCGDTSFWSGWRADEVIAWKKITSDPYTER